MDINEILEMKRKYDEAVKTSGEEIVKAVFNELFDNYPEVQACNWHQYIPSFNDGDPCEFTVGELHWQIDGVISKYAPDDRSAEDYDGESKEEDPRWVSSWELKETPLYDVVKVVESTLYRIEDCLEFAFDSNAEITVTRDSITVDEYYCGW
jgi:hypothetical protein